ncbi:hypothetical protein RB600_005195 [Gaeumannomyces tritici]
MKIWAIASWAARAAGVLGALNIRGPSDPAAKRQLQDLVTWDDRSIFVRGERVMVFAGEFHPFRLPVPSLWLDAMQKIRALGMNAVSIYIDWALLEGTQGRYRADGVFALEPFFEAASEAGLYVIARPGPYINAEVSGGGFPGWLTRINGTLRTKDRAYLEASDIYMANICKAIAKAQITNGGPVILFQPENEYSSTTGRTKPFPDGDYVQYIIDQARAAGVVVPMINNDVGAYGNLKPNNGPGSPDIYGHDAYFWGPDDCERPDAWRNADFSWGAKHKDISPKTPHSLVEFQGGSWMSWGGPGYDKCAHLMGPEFMSIFYKTTFGMGVKLLGSYMTVGGANWGNLGNDGGISSYDYGASVREDRRVDRAKYSEVKLVANFVRASEAALALAVPDNATASVAVGPGGQPLEVSRLSVPGPTAENQARTQFLVVRHRDITVATSTPYTLSVRSSRGPGDVSIPRQGGSLTLQGRDAKVHVVDYDAGGVEVVYCTADIFTWKRMPDGRVLLIVYGGVGERHEIGVAEASVAGGGNKGDTTPPSSGNTLIRDGIISFSWEVTEAEKREMIRLGSLDVMLLDRAQARAFWVVDVANHPNATAKKAPTDGALVVKGGYLIRSASLDGSVLRVQGDFDRTATLEFMGVPPQATALSVNGNNTNFSVDATTGFWKTTVLHWKPELKLPDLNSPGQDWRYVDSLPEIRPGYDDARWPRANRTTTPNIAYPNLATPVSLYAADYGFHSGFLVYRGSFVATGAETAVALQTQGGVAFGSAVWLDDKLLGAWPGENNVQIREATFDLAGPPAPGRHTLTVLIDNHGHELNLVSDGDVMKKPRGVMSYNFTSSQPQPAVEWALTGNLGGENYLDLARGPLNEGGLWAERHGYHLPGAPGASWAARHPVADGIPSAGVGFFATRFALDMPRGFDVPLYVVLANSSGSGTGGRGDVAGGNYYRVQVFVNGWQFGRYVSHLGPQDAFHVPEGILDYHGENWLAISLWGSQPGGAKLAGIALTTAPGTAGPSVIMSGYKNVTLVEAPAWTERAGAY